MRFETIDTLPNACPLFVEDAYKHLVNKLGVKSWHWGVPMTGSELERFLMHGMSISKRSDFHDLRTSHKSYDYLRVFDHAICFKGHMGAPFVLTMPYGDNVTFYETFKGFTTDYYEDKARITHACDSLKSRIYNTERWKGQLHATLKFEATIVPNWFKVRENGDFAAIIAMDNWMRELSELGGFPLMKPNV